MEALKLIDSLVLKIDKKQENNDDSKNDIQYTLGYWNIRGLADFIRLAFYYKNIKFNDKRYHTSNDWNKDKFSLGMKFPNIPYLIDHKKKGFILTESSAIAKYIMNSDKYNNNYDAMEMEGVIHDIIIPFFRLCYNKDFNDVKKGYIDDRLMKQEKTKLCYIDNVLKTKKYLVYNDELTFVDLKFFSCLDYIMRLNKEWINKHPNIKRYYNDILSMDFVKKFTNDGHRKLAIVMDVAPFAGKPFDDNP